MVRPAPTLPGLPCREGSVSNREWTRMDANEGRDGLGEIAAKRRKRRKEVRRAIAAGDGARTSVRCDARTGEGVPGSPGRPEAGPLNTRKDAKERKESDLLNFPHFLCVLCDLLWQEIFAAGLQPETTDGFPPGGTQMRRSRERGAGQIEDGRWGEMTNDEGVVGGGCWFLRLLRVLRGLRVR